MKNVLSKLQKARMAMIAKDIRKGARNEFAKYNYMELADFLIPAQQVFESLNMCGLVSFSADLATLTITDLDSGEQVSITSPMSTAALKGCHEVQNLGAVQTYLRRYLWVAALEIVEHDAIDSSPPVDKQAKPAQKAVARETFDSMPDDEKKFLLDLHTKVMSDGNLYAAYESAKNSLDTDEQVAFWSLFDAKQRAMLKASKEKTLLAEQA